MDRKAAADPEWLKRHIRKYGPFVFHDSGDPKIAEQIKQTGLLPWDHPRNPTGTIYEGVNVPRPNHVYVTVPKHPNYFRMDNPSVVAIDLRQIHPARINPDEDAFRRRQDRDKFGLPRHVEEVHPSDMYDEEEGEYGWNDWIADEPADHIRNFDGSDQTWADWGEAATDWNLNHPQQTEYSGHEHGLQNLALFGMVHPSAITTKAVAARHILNVIGEGGQEVAGPCENCQHPLTYAHWWSGKCGNPQCHANVGHMELNNPQRQLFPVSPQSQPRPQGINQKHVDPKELWPTNHPMRQLLEGPRREQEQLSLDPITGRRS